MSQSTFEDDDLFDEAADDIRSDVEDSLSAAENALPEAEAVWPVEADNILGALNTLAQALDTDDAIDHLREAKKWYAMGKRAEVFDDGDDLEARIETLDGVLGDVETAHERASELASTVPGLRGTLDEAHADGGTEEADAEEGGSDGEAADESEAADADETADADEANAEAAE